MYHNLSTIEAVNGCSKTDLKVRTEFFSKKARKKLDQPFIF